MDERTMNEENGTDICIRIDEQIENLKLLSPKLNNESIEYSENTSVLYTMIGTLQDMKMCIREIRELRYFIESH
ncbi:MAG: hypothetical protein C0417_10225 [Chlorobiaceae bacterium]|nr:hypothetical protein [Chlorobiaceae bacterium]